MPSNLRAQFPWVRHSGHDLLYGFDRIVLMRLDLRQLVVHGLRQFALFEIEVDELLHYQIPSNRLVGDARVGPRICRPRYHDGPRSISGDSRYTPTMLFSDLEKIVTKLSKAAP